MKRSVVTTIVALSAALSSAGGAESSAGRTLDIYFLDMAGGGSTLIVAPTGRSVLIDTGSLEPAHRDADRIIRACRDARIEQIDFLVTTHFDVDHYGAVLEVSRRIPVKCFVDKGALPSEEQRRRQRFDRLYPLYRQATGGETMTIQAGDDIPLEGDSAAGLAAVRLHCVASEKRIEGFSGDIDAPVEGYIIKEPDLSDNSRSIALVLTYGRFRFFAGGDITWNVEHHLAHPVNRIGRVDLYQVTHHGLDMSNNPVLLEAISPTVCVAMNGPRKGIQPNTFAALGRLPSVRAVYQIHYNTQYGDRGNTARELIANADDPERGRFIKASVNHGRGEFTLSFEGGGPERTFPIQ